MKVFATRVKERAAELSIPMAEVARRSGISERRMGHYVSERSEPDLQLLVKIADALGVTPNYLLGIEPRAPFKRGDEAGRIRSRITATCAVLDDDALPLALALLEAILDKGRRKN